MPETPQDQMAVWFQQYPYARLLEYPHKTECHTEGELSLMGVTGGKAR